MASDDIKQMAWTVVAEHMTRGVNDPAKMVAEGIRRERERWAGAGHIAVYPQDDNTGDEECLFHHRRPYRDRGH